MSYVRRGLGSWRRRGLGDTPTLQYCQSLNFKDFVFTPGCWGWGVPNTIAYAGLPSTPGPVTTLPPPSNVPPSSATEADAAVNAAIAANVAANQAANQEFFGNLAAGAPPPSPPGPTIDWSLVVLVAVGAVIGVAVLQRLTRVSRYSR